MVRSKMRLVAAGMCLGLVGCADRFTHDGAERHPPIEPSQVTLHRIGERPANFHRFGAIEVTTGHPRGREEARDAAEGAVKRLAAENGATDVAITYDNVQSVNDPRGHAKATIKGEAGVRR